MDLWSNRIGNQLDVCLGPKDTGRIVLFVCTEIPISRGLHQVLHPLPRTKWDLVEPPSNPNLFTYSSQFCKKYCTNGYFPVTPDLSKLTRGLSSGTAQWIKPAPVSTT